jgi:methyl-accepting chemotaxis protein
MENTKMMTTRARRSLTVLLLVLAAVIPARGFAQGRSPVAIPEGLPTQDKEMLAVALDFSRRCTETLEKWIASKEVMEERLFSSLYYPVAKTDPPKFTTDWDKLSDRDVLPISEAVLGKSAVLAYAVLVDKHGYLPTHNQRYSQPLTGNTAVDLINNRTKRIFNDRTGLLAARSQAPFLFQRYERDTGESMVDLAVPVFVKGQHWGAVRLGYRQVEGR